MDKYTNRYIFASDMEKKHDKAERTKAYIIEKAALLFNTKGYIGTSLSDLTAVSGLTKGSLYGNFENKEQLALAAFTFNFDWLLHGLRASVKQQYTAKDKLMAIVHFYRTNLVKLSEMGGCPILNASTEADDDLPFLQKNVREALGKWKTLLQQIMEKGKEQSEIKKSIDTNTYTSVLISLIEGGIMQTKITNQPRHLNASLDRIERIIMEELVV